MYVVATWESEYAGIETCPQCGARYIVEATRLPVRESDVAYCEKCGCELRQWNDKISYDYRLVEPG